MSCVSNDSLTATTSANTLPLAAFAKKHRTVLKSAGNLKSKCQQIRQEWSNEEEGRRKRMADVMQVRLLDALTA